GISTVDDIEQHTLVAFDMDGTARPRCAVQLVGDVDDKRAQAITLDRRNVVERRDVYRRLAEIVFEGEVVKVDRLLEPRLQCGPVEQVRDPESATGDLVLVGRADAAAGRAACAGAAPLLSRPVEGDVTRQD